LSEYCNECNENYCEVIEYYEGLCCKHSNSCEPNKYCQSCSEDWISTMIDNARDEQKDLLIVER